MNFKYIKTAKGLIFNYFSSIFSAIMSSEFLNDDYGGLVLPISGKAYNDEDFIEYQKLKVDWGMEPIDYMYFPPDFCDRACRLVDEFRRKTVNEDIEWMLYFDYTTGDIVYCWKGKEGKTGGDYERIHFHGRNIASVHSHTSNYYSFPSPENFDMLENEFEDYEIITSVDVFWIVEFKGVVNHEMKVNFQGFLTKKFDELILNVISNNDSNINEIIEEEVSNYLLHEMNIKINDVFLDIIKGGINDVKS